MSAKKEEKKKNAASKEGGSRKYGIGRRQSEAWPLKQ
jgi:hypothetical protein